MPWASGDDLWMAYQRTARRFELVSRFLAQGNSVFQAKRHVEAVRLYGEAIAEADEAAPGVYFSNHAVCQAALGEWACARGRGSTKGGRPGEADALPKGTRRTSVAASCGCRADVVPGRGAGPTG